MNMYRLTLSGPALALLLGLPLSLAGCGGGSDDSSDTVASLATTTAGLTLPEQINALPLVDLSADESESLLFMREEEKLARDVYLFLDDIWADQTFSSIAAAEQRHTDAVLAVIEKYALPDPAADQAEGRFVNQTLQNLYDLLIARGQASLIDALIVGATIEDLDINDLQTQLKVINNTDMILVYENLLQGSRNHLRAFTGRLTDLGMIYVPAYISQEDYDAIVSSPFEQGQ